MLDKFIEWNALPAYTTVCIFAPLKKDSRDFNIGHTSEQINVFFEGQALQGVGILTLLQVYAKRVSCKKKNLQCNLDFYSFTNPKGSQLETYNLYIKLKPVSLCHTKSTNQNNNKLTYLLWGNSEPSVKSIFDHS